MVARERIVCTSDSLAEGGDGIRFVVTHRGETLPAFVVRFGGLPRAYVNRCVHMPRELDWVHGQFFDSDKVLLVCSSHGALYYPESGKCYLGPCGKGGLVRLEVRERDGQVRVLESVAE
jgi:nitrite reductase/ring-hydroxylating ferredoxin subunit